jgi:hypothetical protein
VDDPHVEITDPRRPDDLLDHRHPSRLGARAKRGRRLALAMGTTVLALFVVAGAWLHEQASGNGAQSRYATPLPTETTRPTPTPVLTPTPLPVTGPLAAPPTNCPTSVPLDTTTVPTIDGFTLQPTPVLGRSPVWAYSLPQDVVNLDQPPATSPSWPELKIVWFLGPTRHPHVTVQVTDLRSGDVAWWALHVPSTPQVPTLTMDPDVEFPGSAQETWVAEPTTLLITHAGCYQLDVNWPGGGWQTVFAAGQVRS